MQVTTIALALAIIVPGGTTADLRAEVQTLRANTPPPVLEPLPAKRSVPVQPVPPRRTVSPSRASAPRGEVVDLALKQLGKPYLWGASGPNSFDCSGLTRYVYAKVGVNLPHSSRAQSGLGTKIPRSELQPGDLVFFGSPVHHVGIYVGGGKFIHSPRSGETVRVDSLANRKNFSGARRP